MSQVKIKQLFNKKNIFSIKYFVKEDCRIEEKEGHDNAFVRIILPA